MPFSVKECPTCDVLRSRMEQLKQERDEERRFSHGLSAARQKLLVERDHMRAKVEQLAQERDEFERKLYELESEQS
jgi:uncharacterized coiled-coil DUF342 family protein